jgi:hypothetical protein
MVAKGHKITNVPLFKKLWDIIFFFGTITLAQKVIVPQKKNYVPQFLKQRDINSYYVLLPYIIYVMQSGRFSHCPAFLSLTVKERDKKYSVKSP